MSQQRRVCFVTSTRADWGLLSPVAAALSRRPDTLVSIVATNMHLDPRYGLTVGEIRADGFGSVVEVPVHHGIDDDSGASRAVIMGRVSIGVARAFESLSPDMVVILGDRYEMLSVASVASVMRIPIVHIAGGEITEGAVDDSIRHAITKLSSLHLTATEAYRRRVISMGEDPQFVINTGSVGVDNIMRLAPLSRRELEESIGMSLGPDALLVTWHPVTMESPDSVAVGCRALLDALDCFPASQVIITYPNNDACGRVIIDLIEEYGRRNPDRVRVIPSLGRVRYISALRYVAAVVGNSSSGIVEVPSAGIPTVDIGSRQKGRIAGDSVIHCPPDTGSIAGAIRRALSPGFRAIARRAPNPYHRSGTLDAMVSAIALTPLGPLRHKRFIDNNPL